MNIRRQAWPYRIAAVGLLVALAGTYLLWQFSTRPHTDSQLPAGSSTHTIEVDGLQRTFRIYRPESISPNTPAPLVVMLHGALGTGSQAESAYGWNEKADSGQFIVAYPDGIKRSWAVSDTCCGPPAADHVSDVNFITRMVADISDRHSIDSKKIYATGISNGGMLAYRLACDTTLFAAIGPDSATMLGTCPSPTPTSVIHIHGTADQTIPYAGGPGKRDNGGAGDRPADTNGPAIPALIDTWRHANSCASATTATLGVVTTSTATCPDNRAITLVTIEGSGHQWPGATPARSSRLNLDPPSTALDATDTIWNFFKAHPKSE